jgi:hypothetical protein
VIPTVPHEKHWVRLTNRQDVSLSIVPPPLDLAYLALRK